KLKEETREQGKPQVLKRASEIFSRITSGRYSLEVDPQGTAFRAYDHKIGLGQRLDELSSGTRVQLILAVRLAFLEQQEVNVTMPLLADELLANSDDARAAAIIEALTEISRDGRQIIYFTAQQDEVQKWKAKLHNSDLDLKVHLLNDS